nr:MAG TPA_asm: hypothetical protein [Caudoviricetes sp.]
MAKNPLRGQKFLQKWPQNITIICNKIAVWPKTHFFL